jgi:hypothetical protein
MSSNGTEPPIDDVSASVVIWGKRLTPHYKRPDADGAVVAIHTRGQDLNQAYPAPPQFLHGPCGLQSCTIVWQVLTIRGG